MDKLAMDKALEDAATLAALIQPELLQRRATQQYDAIMESIGDLVVAVAVNAFVGDSERLESAKKALKDNISRLDALCDRFSVEARHDHLRKYLENKNKIGGET